MASSNDINKDTKIMQPNTQIISKDSLFKEEYIVLNNYVYQLANNPKKIRIMTFNVKGYNYKSFKKPQIIEEIYKINPDIICLQEHMGAVYKLDGYVSQASCKSEH